MRLSSPHNHFDIHFFFQIMEEDILDNLSNTGESVGVHTTMYRRSVCTNANCTYFIPRNSTRILHILLQYYYALVMRYCLHITQQTCRSVVSKLDKLHLASGNAGNGFSALGIIIMCSEYIHSFFW